MPALLKTTPAYAGATTNLRAKAPAPHEGNHEHYRKVARRNAPDRGSVFVRREYSETPDAAFAEYFFDVWTSLRRDSKANAFEPAEVFGDASARRAINTIKDRVAGMRWRVQPRQGLSLEEIPEGAQRIRILTDNFNAPNPDDSFRSLAEQVLEDINVGGYGEIEVQATGDPSAPLVETSEATSTSVNTPRPCGCRRCAHRRRRV